MERIAYVILTWNSRRHIAACLRAIYGITSLGAQIIVVDNGSADGTAELLEELARECPGHCSLEVVKNPRNLGTTRPRNQGLARVGRDAAYICILDADTQVNQAAMEELAGQLRRHPEYGIVGPRMADGSGREQLSGRNFPTPWEKLCKAAPIPALQALGERLERPPGWGSPRPCPVGYLMSACWLMPRELPGLVGGLDERIFYAPEDADYCARVWEAGRQVVFCPGARILHHWQRLSRQKLLSRHNWEHLMGLLYFFRKHRAFLRRWNPPGNPGENGAY